MENYEIKKKYQPRKVAVDLSAQKKKFAEMEAEPTTERHQRIRIAPKKVSNHTWSSSKSPGEGVQFFFQQGGA